MKKLLKIQEELKAPKGQYNSYGGFSYRSCEDILEAVKPILSKHELVLTLTDTMQCIGDRFYVCAEACIIDTDGRTCSVRAHAREQEHKKGMDASQITGAASSYARKYALNGLFLIDDTKDADTMPPSQDTEKGKRTQSKPKTGQNDFEKEKKKATEEAQKIDKVTAYKRYIKDRGLDPAKCKQYLVETYGEDIQARKDGVNKDFTNIMKHFEDNINQFKKGA